MENKIEQVFVDGMSAFAPRENAPEFILANLSISPGKLIAFLKEHKQYMSDKGYFSVDLKKSTKGSYYLSLNTYKPGNVPAPKQSYTASANDPVEGMPW